MEEQESVHTHEELSLKIKNGEIRQGDVIEVRNNDLVFSAYVYAVKPDQISTMTLDSDFVNVPETTYFEDNREPIYRTVRRGTQPQHKLLREDL